VAGSLRGHQHSIAAEIEIATSERGKFNYGEQVIHYDVIRTSDSAEALQQKTKRKVKIKVHPDQRVVAIAPNDAISSDIQKAILKRARWIWQSINDFASQYDFVLPKKYVSGDSQFYLGKRYVLKVMIDTEQVTNVKLYRGKLTVTLNREYDDRSNVVKSVLNEWYFDKAKYKFHERLSVLLPKADWVKGIPSFRVMAMSKQWGSCSVKGNLMLNPHLVKAPKECIDYVILHELCHIEEHNHSERFWRLLTQIMPNWREVKDKLDDMAELYLNE